MTATKRASHRRLATFAAVGIAALAAFTASSALAVTPAAPGWSVSSLATPTNFKPGDGAGDYTYDLRVANIGAAKTDGSPITIVDTLPAKLVALGNPEFKLRFQEAGEPFPKEIALGPTACEKETVSETTTVTCILEELAGDEDHAAVVEPGEELRIVIRVSPVNLLQGEALTNHVEVEGGGAPAIIATSHNEASSEPAPGGFSYYQASVTGPGGQPAVQAGSHPYQFTTSYAVNTRPGSEGVIVPAGGDVKDVRVALPPGLVGNPNATELCTAQKFNTTKEKSIGEATYEQNGCPDGSVVGVVVIKDAEGRSELFPAPVYNLVPPPGMPAQLGFQYVNIPFYIDTELEPRGDGGYAIVGVLRNQSQARRVSAASVTLWGTPAAESHDPLRGSCLVPILPHFRMSRCESGGGPEEKPFLRLPTNCVSPLDLTMSFSNWTHPADPFLSETSSGAVSSGCNQLNFEPALEARPTTDVADSPSGLHVDLHIPQKEHEGSEELGEADLRDVAVSFPKGLVVNPSSGNGLDACTPAQVGLTSKAGVEPPTFDAAPAHCPDAARIGTVRVKTPLLDHPLPGSVYVASPNDNPFHSLLAIYIAVHDPVSGVVAKLAGKVTPDLVTGRLSSTFARNPQVPFEDFELDFFGGPAAALRTPAVCAPYSTDSVLTPWSAPESGPPAAYSDRYAITKEPGGGACPTAEGTEPNAPSFEAGSIAPIAAAYTPFAVHLRREDGSQEFSSLTVSAPPGLIAKLRGVLCCPETALADAAIKSGRKELASPSCPAASELGTANVGAGAGPAPYYIQGRAYLACGPYKGAPLYLAVITPATAGPYDLGTVVVRAALYVDSETARVTAVSDPLPHVLQGIPVDVRTIAVKLDRPDFTLNPTNCSPLQVSGSEVSVFGQAAPLSDRFQVGECGRLKFAPKLNLRLFGGTRRGAHPALRAVVTYPQGAYANTARASVALPHSEFLEQAHIRTICTRVQFAAHACPAGSIYGYAKATSPLVDYTVEGPIYLRSSSNPLPDLVMALHGPPSQPVEIDAVARIDSVHGGIRATFETVPDVPLGKVVVSMRGGTRGLLVNSRNICRSTNRAVAKFDAQNGKVADSKPVLRAKCKKPKKHRKNS